MNTCSKRVIIHPGVDLTVGVSAALAFDKEYVNTDDPKPLGIYHARTYTGHDGNSDETRVDVHQSVTSIIVRLSEPVPEPEDKPDLASLTPEFMAQVGASP